MKIKNRLSEAMNDAMVMFRMKDSALVCELQLILDDDSEEDQKSKNRETLNHFLYELERSLFGVQS